MADTAIFPKGWVPDLFLYNSDQTHYDLLVAEDHRVALLGLVATKPDVEEPLKQHTEEAPITDDDGWKQIERKKNKESSEKLLEEEEANFEDYDTKDLEELDEEVILSKSKDSGFKRTDPSAPSESISKEKIMYACTWKKCKMFLESEGLLRAHEYEHRNQIENECTKCAVSFVNKDEVKEHIKLYHSEGEWNCYNCSFQAHSSSELMNHLKLTGHQPSTDIQNQRSKITHCYTCKEEFSSYYNLMNHRKQKHPSNRTCKYFLKNECVHGANCWYRHDEPMETDNFSSRPTNIRCGLGEKTFRSPDNLRVHKKKEHAEQDNLVFRLTRPNPVPPESMEQVMKTLNLVLLKMQEMEKRFSQNQQ